MRIPLLKGSDVLAERKRTQRWLLFSIQSVTYRTWPSITLDLWYEQRTQKAAGIITLGLQKRITFYKFFGDPMLIQVLLQAAGITFYNSG